MRFFKIFILCFLFSIFLIGCNDADNTNSSDNDQEQEHDQNHEQDTEQAEGNEPALDADVQLIVEAKKEWKDKLNLGECKEVEYKTDSFVTICNHEAMFRNEEELKKSFPNIPKIDLKLDYEIKQIFVSMKPEATELIDVHSWSDFPSFIINLYKEGNSIALTYMPVEPILDPNIEDIKEETYNNENYKVVSNKSDSQYSSINTKVSISDKDYYLVASNTSSDGKTFLNEKEFIDLIDSNFRLLLE